MKTIAVRVGGVLGVAYFVVSHDLQRDTVTPAFERAPSAGIVPGRPSTPREKGG